MIGNINAQREKEDALKKILHLEKQLDAKQALELEIEQLKGKLQVLKHMEGDDDTVQKKVLEMIKELEEKEGEMGDLEALNQTLIVKERKSNDELQDARKELIVVFFFFDILPKYFFPMIIYVLFIYILDFIYHHRLMNSEFTVLLAS